MNHIIRLNVLTRGKQRVEISSASMLLNQITKHTSSSSSPTHCTVGFHTGPSCPAGHSKWSKIKRPKAIADHKRSQRTGKLCLEIISAIKVAKDSCPESNLHLARAISRARSYGVPKSTIEGAINSALRHSDSSEAAAAEKVLYEGRGPQGYSLLIEAITDNKKRTRPEIRTILTQKGGHLGESGSVLYQFNLKGIVMVSKDSLKEFEDILEVAINIGAEEVLEGVDDNDHECYHFICEPKDLESVTNAASEEYEALHITQSVLSYIPNTFKTLSSAAIQKALSLVSKLEEHPDVIRVYNNFIEEQNEEIND